MITLTLRDGSRFDMFPSAIHIIEEIKGSEDQETGTTLALDLGDGMITEELGDKYGFARKAVLETGAMRNPIEVRMAGDKHRVTFSRDAIIARRELKDAADGGNTILFVSFNGGPTLRWTVDNTIAQLDGDD